MNKIITDFKILKYYFLFLILCLFISCKTFPTNKNVAENLTPTELKQLAQNEFDKGFSRRAMAYYQILIDRYGTDMSIRISGEYEIAHLNLRKKKWAQAEKMLKQIIERYESSGGAGLVPKYYVLAKNDYAKIQARNNKKNKNLSTK